MWRNKNMKVYVCCIAKMENLYIREWVEHYMKIGFDRVIVVDNNDIDGERFDDVIDDYINSGFVQIIDFRGRIKSQFDAYNYVYRHNDADWIAFFDVDEYLFLQNYDNVKDYISTFDEGDTDVIKINWMCYGDCGKLYYENIPLNERFSSPISFKSSDNANRHTKCIVRCNLFDKHVLYSANPHVPLGTHLKYKDSMNRLSDSSPFQCIDFSEAYIKHFTTKTIEEFVKNKMVRGFPDVSPEVSKRIANLDLFFSYNEKTDEKLKVAYQFK